MNQPDRDDIGWSLVALDLKIDSTTYTGRMFLHLLAALADWSATGSPHHTARIVQQSPC